MDLLKSTYPDCPHCCGTGKHLFSVSTRGSSVNGDWIAMMFSAKALGNWDKLDSDTRAMIEDKVKRARYTPGKREYMTCPRCQGSGRLVPHIEAAWQHNERLAQAFFRSRGWL